MTVSPGPRTDVDADLVEALRREDPEAAEQLVDRFGDRVYRITANAAYQKLRTRRQKSAEIAIDDVLPSLDDDGRHFEPMDDWSNRVDERALQGELRQVLQEAIDGLPAEYRTALVMHDVEGLSNPDIAETLGISLPAVKSRVHRSRLFVRKRLAEYLQDGQPKASAPNG